MRWKITYDFSNDLFDNFIFILIPFNQAPVILKLFLEIELADYQKYIPRKTCKI